MLTIQDRLDINETLALHAYIFDDNKLDRMEELFTPDAVYDMSATASGVKALRGIDTIRTAASHMAESGHAPVAHFVTNIVATYLGDDAATVQSRGLMIMADGSPHAVTHNDVLERSDGHWRISQRVITPVGAAAAAEAGSR